MMEKYTYIIGIPAFNEAKSIANTLTALCSQKTDASFVRKGIIVYSDASTDDTANKVLSVKNKSIQLITSRKRKGKAHAVKELLYLAQKQKADFLVLIDADLRIRDTFMLQKLLTNISSHADIAATSGTTFPLRPENFVQQIGFIGNTTWKHLLTRAKEKEIYFRSSDNFIALRVKDFPKKIIDAYSYIHDEFYYLYCRKYHKKFTFEKKAIAYFVLPDNIHEYITQMTRYVGQHMSKKEREILGSGFSFSSYERLFALVACAKQDYAAAIAYFFLQLYIRFSKGNTMKRFNAAWPQITSTKTL